MKKGEDELQLAIEKMFVAEAFAIQHQIIKSQRRHARENWNPIRHRYIHIFVRYVELKAICAALNAFTLRV